MAVRESAAQSDDSSIQPATDRDWRNEARDPDDENVKYAATSSTPAFRIDQVVELEPWLAATLDGLLAGAFELLNRHTGE